MTIKYVYYGKHGNMQSHTNKKNMINGIDKPVI